jgi:hypothetical protein
VAAIDTATLHEYGPWPLPRDQLARIVNRLQRFKPKAVGFMLALGGTETATAVSAMRNELDNLDTPLRNKARTWLTQLDTDSQLARALENSRKLVLLVPSVSSDVETQLPEVLKRYSVHTEHEALPWYRSALRWPLSAPVSHKRELSPPDPLFLDAVHGVGSGDIRSHRRAVQGTALLIETAGQYLPGFELALMAAAEGSSTAELSVKTGTGLFRKGDKVLDTADLNFYSR